MSHCSSFGEGPLPERDISVDNPVLADTAMVSQADGDAKRFSPDPLQSQVVTQSLNCDCSSNNPPQLVAEGLRGQLRSDFRRSYQPYPHFMEKEDK